MVSTQIGINRTVYDTNVLTRYFAEFTNLVHLSYAYIMNNNNTKKQVAETTLTNKDVQLQHLDINHTAVSDSELINLISRFKNLVELKLGGCDALTTRGLSFLPRGMYILHKNQQTY